MVCSQVITLRAPMTRFVAEVRPYTHTHTQVAIKKVANTFHDLIDAKRILRERHRDQGHYHCASQHDRLQGFHLNEPDGEWPRPYHQLHPDSLGPRLPVLPLPNLRGYVGFALFFTILSLWGLPFVLLCIFSLRRVVVRCSSGASRARPFF